MTREEITQEIRKQISYVLYLSARIPLTGRGCEELRQIYNKCLIDSVGLNASEIRVNIILKAPIERGVLITVDGPRDVLEELCTPPLRYTADPYGIEVIVNINGE